MKKNIDQSYLITELVGIEGWDKDLGEDFKEYRRKWSEVSEKHQLLSFPLHLDFEVNYSCNYKCIMCPRGVIDKKEELMDRELYFKIIDEGSKNGLCAVGLAGLGEPLLRKDIFELIKYAKSKGILDVMISTNASLLTEEASKRLLDAGLTRIQFSLDAFKKETYEKVRIGGNYENVIKNILRFLELKEKNGLSYPMTRVSFIRMNNNENEVNDFINFWKDKVNIVSIQEYVNPLKQNKIDLNSAKSEVSRKEDFICNQLFQKLYIWPNGMVSFCCVDFGSKLIVGDSNKETIKEIWNSNKLNKFRELHLNHEYYKIETCNLCVNGK